MMNKSYRIFALMALASLSLVSCEKEVVDASRKTADGKQLDPSLVYKRPTTADEIKLVENLAKVTDVFKELYQAKANLNVVNAAINARVYTDESVLLKDLIYPEGSLLAKSTRFQSYVQRHTLSLSAFATNFWLVANKLNDPAFSSFLASLKTVSPVHKGKGGAGRGAEATQVGDEVTVYFPYSEQFMVPYDDNGGGGGEVSYGPVTNLVTATADADAAYGTQSYTDANGVTQYQTVLVDDDYAYNNPTHIIGLNGVEPYAEPTTSNSTTFEPTGPIPLPGAPREIKQVYVGDVRCKHQYDALVSFTDNGGGSEIRFTRADGFLKLADGQVQADMYVTGDQSINRYNIRKGRFVEYSSQWDGDWELANLNENLAIYEEDNRNSVEINGSLTTTLTASAGNTVVGVIGFKGTYKSDDALIAQTGFVRATFFALNRTDLEGQMQRSWPVRDKNARVSYTLQDRTFIP